MVRLPVELLDYSRPFLDFVSSTSSVDSETIFSPAFLSSSSPKLNLAFRTQTDISLFWIYSPAPQVAHTWKQFLHDEVCRVLHCLIFCFYGQKVVLYHRSCLPCQTYFQRHHRALLVRWWSQGHNGNLKRLEYNGKKQCNGKCGYLSIIKVHFSLVLPKNILRCGYSFEPPCRGDSNEYPQHTWTLKGPS